MRLIQSRTLCVACLTILALLIAGCSQATDAPPTTPIFMHGSSTIQSIEVDLLTNIKDNGFDGSGPGGLWVNWRYGTQPLQTNINGTGEPDGVSVSPPRHDELTDLRYIHNLWSYKRQNPRDTRFDGEIARYTLIIKSEFAHAHNERGWLYDEAIALYQLTHDSFYRDMAISLASSYARAYNARVGSIFQTSVDHPHGSYRVDMVLEEGCALIQAGTFFQRPEWQQIGAGIVNFVYTTPILCSIIPLQIRWIPCCGPMVRSTLTSNFMLVRSKITRSMGVLPTWVRSARLLSRCWIHSAQPTSRIS